MQKTGLRKIFCLLILVVLALWTDGARAQDPLCDTALFNQMVERARLQGQRETVVNENLIYKPDSVLEYTCYLRFVDPVPPNVTYYISGAHLTPLASDPVPPFLFANFNHTFLGGRLSSSPAIVAPGADYTCDAMQAAFAVAKCVQFAPEEPQDGFYDLLAFTSAAEIRRYPTLCSGPAMTGFGVVPVQGAILYTSALAVPTDCGEAIPTGEVIDLPLRVGEAARPVIYNEKFCANPTCLYKPTALDTGTCNP